MDALRVFLDASEAVRADRITNREGGATLERLQEIQARETSDRRRYRDIYGVDYHDHTLYDVVVETDRRTPEDLAGAGLGVDRDADRAGIDLGAEQVEMYRGDPEL